MATAIRFCKICKKIFKARGNRKTCSDDCHTELTHRRAVSAYEAKPPTPPTKQPAKPKKPVGSPRFLPSPEEIRLKCSLMRSGLLVIENDGTPREVDPAG